MLKQENLALYAFQSFGDNALRAAYCCTGSRTAAEQTAKAVFCMLRRDPPALKDDAALKAWVLRNVIERCASVTQSEKPENDLQKRLADLPPHCAEIVYLHDCERYSVAEIAELLCRSELTVTAQLADCRRVLGSAEGDCA